MSKVREPNYFSNYYTSERGHFYFTYMATVTTIYNTSLSFRVHAIADKDDQARDICREHIKHCIIDEQLIKNIKLKFIDMIDRD